ncbi:MAG: chemotaxis protein CheD [Clostridiales bacterium]|nr:chemotaxis protein CheD [Clostridiales bacterium]
MDKNIKDIIVGIADYKIAQGPGRLITLGLGSCVGVCIYDMALTIGGMAHILLPDSSQFPKDARAEKFADLAIPKMVEEMVSHGASVKNLAAKIAGGAAMFPLSESSKNMDIGKRYVDAVRACLNELGIPILAENVGGSLARTMIMDVKERLVIIKMPGLAEKIL